MSLGRVAFSVFWERLIGVCDEQVTALLRTSFSPVVREAGDLAAGVFDTRGRMLAQPQTGTPGHMNPLSVAVKNLFAVFPPERIRPGDVLITNDPWLTTGQLLDVTVLVPTFRDGELLAAFACTCHMVDVGGYGTGAGAADTFEEGVRIPPMYLREDGRLNETLDALLRANIRDPEHFMGDLEAMIASCQVGGRKLLAIVDEYGLADLDEVADEILLRSRTAQEQALRALPDGTYHGETLIDGFEEPIVLRCAVTLHDGSAHVDFAGSSPESSHGINVVMNYAAGYATFGVRAATAPGIPNNDGSMAPITVTAPKGCVVNAQPPAPTTGRHLVGMFVADPVLDALRPLVMDRTLAEGAGAVWGLEVRVRRDGGSSPLFVTISGGMGARAESDGLSTVSFPASIAGVPIEVWEATIPMVVHRRELRIDSGGAGRRRGGLGQTVELSVPQAERWIANLMSDRIVHPARGAFGGGHGAPGHLEVNGEAPPTGKARVTLGPDGMVRLETPGGGGWGPATEREPERVAADVEQGYVSREQAEALYGVVLDEAGGVLAGETKTLRDTMGGT